MPKKTMHRILRELREVGEDARNFVVEPLDEDPLSLHFTMRGPEDSPYEAGRYHGVVSLTANYPFDPPSVTFLTPNGRFAPGQALCLSSTAYHPELWQPSWTLRTHLVAIQAFMQEESAGIGSIKASASEPRVWLKSHWTGVVHTVESHCGRWSLREAHQSPRA